jgi:hypothetical protein
MSLITLSLISHVQRNYPSATRRTRHQRGSQTLIFNGHNLYLGDAEF